MFYFPLQMVSDLRNFVTGARADLAVWDIIRGRDHGLPSYTQARVRYGLSPVATFEDITDDAVVVTSKLSISQGCRGARTRTSASPHRAPPPTISSLPASSTQVAVQHSGRH